MRNGKKHSKCWQAAISTIQALEPRLLFSVINGGGPNDPDGSPVPADITPAVPQTPSGATLPLSSVPQLHSLPGSTYQIDPDLPAGAPAQQWGGYSVTATPAFDQDGDPTSFSSGELAAIQETWRRVAEKYSPFNIDVTTVAPASLVHGKNMEVVIGGNGAWSGGGYGGLSYTGAFLVRCAQRLLGLLDRIWATMPCTMPRHRPMKRVTISSDHQSTWSGTTLSPNTTTAMP